MKIKYLFFAIIASVCVVGCKKKETKPVVASTEEVSDSTNKAPDVEMIKDFTMTSVDGKKISLKDEVAKHEITIVDFWASWCGPCMHEVPNLVSIYNKYKDSGRVQLRKIKRRGHNFLTFKDGIMQLQDYME